MGPSGAFREKDYRSHSNQSTLERERVGECMHQPSEPGSQKMWGRAGVSGRIGANFTQSKGCAT